MSNGTPAAAATGGWQRANPSCWRVLTSPDAADRASCPLSVLGSSQESRDGKGTMSSWEGRA